MLLDKIKIADIYCFTVPGRQENIAASEPENACNMGFAAIAG